MRKLAVPAALAVLLLFQQSAPAQTVPPNTLLSGHTQQVVRATSFGGSCYVARGFSTFRRNGLTAKALISFDELVDSAVWDLSGDAVMTFATSATGTIQFRPITGIPAPIRERPFINYAQTYDSAARRLTVTFTIRFPDCLLPINAVYDLT